jgi:hypothetical protein
MPRGVRRPLSNIPNGVTKIGGRLERFIEPGALPAMKTVAASLRTQ